MYLFDTDVLSQIIRRAPPPVLLARLAQVPPEHHHTTAITVGEMVYGAHRSPRGESLVRQLNTRVWPHVRILPFDRDAAEAYGSLRARLERARTPLSEPDMRIAAIALTHRLTLVTGNVRHFARVPGLRIENWLS